MIPAVPGQKLDAHGRAAPMSQADHIRAHRHAVPSLDEAIAEVPGAREAIAGTGPAPDPACRTYQDMSPRAINARALVASAAALAQKDRDAARAAAEVPPVDAPRSFQELLSQGTEAMTKLHTENPTLYARLRAEHFDPLKTPSTRRMSI